MSESVASMSSLRRCVERLEGRRAPGMTARFATGHEGIDSWLGGGLAQGRLHELIAAGEDAGCGAGFAAMLAMLAGGGRPLLWLRTDNAQRRCGRLQATGLGELGVAGGMLLLGLVADEAALLNASADAARCAGLGAVLVECWGRSRLLDLTATRRLMLAAEASGVTMLLLRIAGEEMPSAAETRWRVAPSPSTPLPDGSSCGAPGHPMFDVELLRRRAGPAGRAWRLEWDRDRKSFRAPPGEPALSGAVLPVAAG
ncbi:ImuA family protein [uncultured Sphingomonas sp.]|uniref:ImuA family protein n=1 Tax=uncultured Sphingomonas sp. TaxID=158754 RepID=UPI0035CA7814